MNPERVTGAKGTQSSPEDLFLPFSMQPLIFPGGTSTGDSLLTSDREWWMQIMARAKPGVNEARARAALDVALKSAVRATMTVKPNESVPDVVTDGRQPRS